MSVQHRTMIGGQAVIEGVMMRGVKDTAMAVRKPDGSIEVECWQTASVKDRSPFLRLPVVRGVINFVEMLLFGYKCLTHSAEVAGIVEDEEPSEFEQKVQNTLGDKGMKVLTTLSALLGVVIAIALFVVLPTVIVRSTGGAVTGFWRTLLEGGIKIVLFVLYLVLVSRLKDIQRVFEYHGAEHKTIFCYESGEELTVENARKFGRFHPRCGTSFLLIVLIVSILVFSLVTWSSVLTRVLLKLLLLPVVVGISYEIIRFAGRHDNSFLRFLLAPGLWLQRLTTREPDDSQLEVAIKSLQAVLTDNREDDKW